MKKLVLTPITAKKLGRLDKKVGDLKIKGADLESYDGLKFVAIVGTRKPTNYGRKITEDLASGLARAGVVVVSGLAFGIDSIAHKACLDVGGRTIAILPSGINNINPASHRRLADEIIEGGGTLISEYSDDHQPRKVEFLERNRIVAGLCDLVIIPEAAANSGSLNTANHALKMKIPILVVPGNITSPMSEGTNFLLKGDANAITSVSDVLKKLGIKTTSNNHQLSLMGENEAETLILQKISLGVSDNESLQSETKLDTTEYQTTLTMLEISGRITQDSSGNWNLS